MANTTNGKSVVGSKHPGTGYLYVLVLMFIAIMAGMVLSGGNIPADPNGPKGPPSLPPYFNPNDYDAQKIVLPTGALTPDPKGNLQLKTFSVNTCGTTTAVDFLIDTSASMEDYHKIDKLKAALTQFTKRFSKRTAVAIQTFDKKVVDKVEFGLYKDNNADVQLTIDSLKPEGWTTARDGFERADQVINKSITTNQFPGYHYAMVLMTDGVPEIPPQQPRTCEGPQVPDPYEAPALRCFSKEQDPRIPTNIAAEIKRMGVQIYTVGIFSELSSDVLLEPTLKQLLQDEASQPLSTHYFTSLDANNMNTILSSIFDQFCDTELVQ